MRGVIVRGGKAVISTGVGGGKAAKQGNRSGRGAIIAGDSVPCYVLRIPLHKGPDGVEQLQKRPTRSGARVPLLTGIPTEMAGMPSGTP